MSDSVLTHEQATKLLRELQSNSGFAARFQDKPAAAMLEIGIPAVTIANLPAACLARCKIDPTSERVRETLATLEKSATVAAQSMAIPTVKLSS
jgi:putative modified peptide